MNKSLISISFFSNLKLNVSKQKPVFFQPISEQSKAKSKQTGITFRCYYHGFKTPYQLHTPLIEFHGLHTAHHRVLGPGCYSIEP